MSLLYFKTVRGQSKLIDWLKFCESSVSFAYFSLVNIEIYEASKKSKKINRIMVR